MALSNSTNVRLSNDLKGRLENIAKQSGLKIADLIRMATEMYCDQIECSGKLSINIQGNKNKVKVNRPL
jgi:predicted DNA-binding protein